MELILLRHGKAEDHRSEGDFDRRLVDKGMRQARRAARLLGGLDRLPEVVLSSPRIRAKETAEHFCDEVGLGAPVIQSWLDCGMNPEEAMRELAAFSEFERVMIVGHEPDFSMLVESWIECRGGVEVKKGALVGLEVMPPRRGGRLVFLVPPKMVGGS
ncbi:phosphohistidine phosphatase [Haloferula luteola]|uniref:Phosphohistidine phosphatase n=1 Tax=Haloferula luteola TaxID=595692 RepID=A0A840V556_9BACT|nr:histidine phosphatase family protein [Haloferula luteola]MBB5352166.1 phosphohistidine phosphatase [Haloferula luteola]